MRPVVLLSLGLLTACGLPDEIDTYTLSIHVNAASVGPLDNILLLASDTPITVGGELPTAPITPAMLASNEPPSTDVEIWGRTPVFFDRSTWPSGATDATFVAEFDYSAFNTYGVVVGWRNVAGARVYGIAELPRDSVAASNDRDTHLDVSLTTGMVVEVWNGCLRMVEGSQTRYVVAVGDYDCDGQFGMQDCKPTTFCDPNATSGPAHDACVCTAAQ